MYLVISKTWQRSGPLVMGGPNPGIWKLVIDRIEDSLDNIKQGEYYSEIKIK